MEKPTPTQLHKFLEAYLSKDLDIDLVETFVKIWKDGTLKEKKLLKLCVSIFSPLKIIGIPSLVKTFNYNATTITEKMSKEKLLEKEIEKLNKEIKGLNETIYELRGNYIDLYRRTNMTKK